MPNDLILKAGDKGIAAQLKLIVLSLAAVESNVVLEALEVDGNGIAGLSRSVLNGNETCVLLSELLSSCVYLLVSNSLDCSLHLDALVAVDGDLRLGNALSLKGNALLAYGSYLNAGLSHEIQLGLGNCAVDSLGSDSIYSLFIENTLAVLSLDELSGSLALAEAGDRYVLSLLEKSRLNSSLELLCGDLDLKLVPVCSNIVYSL